MGRVLGGIRLAGVLLSASALLHSFLSASKIISDGRNKDIPIDQLCDTVHVVVGSLQFQLTTKNEIGNPFRGSLSHFFVGAILQQPPFITTLPYSLGETLSASVPAAHRPALRCHWL